MSTILNKISLLAFVLATFAAAPSSARTWTDSSGRYKVDADLVAYDDDSVVLQREDRLLVSVALETLSETDQAYLATEEARLAAKTFTEQQQTWTTVGGRKIIGNVVDYVARDVTFQRKRGKIYVNDRVFENLPQAYQKIAPQIVAHFEDKPINDEKSLKAWLTHRKGQPATYRCEGVVLELPSGDEYAIPFFLLNEDDLQVLKPGWEEWLAAHNDYQSQADLSNDLRALAAARHQDQQVNQQIAKLQLMMQATSAGVTDLWEVTLYPARGTQGSPLWVVVPGRDSRQAANAALAKNPGYIAGATRKVSR